MAETPLPSPDRMKPLASRLRAVVDSGSSEALVEEIVVTIEARASGRLVDREAVSYETAKLWTDTLRDVAIAQGDDYKTAGILDAARHWLVVTLGVDV